MDAKADVNIQDKVCIVPGHCIPFQQADGHHHSDLVQNIYVNLSLYKRSFNDVIIFSSLMV